MRNAETILSIIRECGKQKLALEDIYRRLYNRDLYLRAYSRLYRNHEAMTPGATSETAGGMALTNIGKIIAIIRKERYQWTPVRRTLIPKKSGKLRALGLPTWSDKLLQEVIRKYQTTVPTPHGSLKALEVVQPRGEGKKLLMARFGGIELRGQKDAVIKENVPRDTNQRHRSLES